ncbi:MAG: UDP-3-O-acyl-N-acetylglucosamine deacetylase [Rhodospirillaceae bacterium]|nr:UDP-3-O-acyl-N-acetylglucosamine deacetylase [Rhodospirillaceae bacterium]MBT3910349.1 UDP-3-O-acyl-N-acetylglucosamine deacetylase [Rhodospirillaceae bacterium]MBT5299509.1 UDP-3-O-acyl-N-acetylglucosamine deacetylase [Rhodospirillaceae bacterium]MBT5513546.1 UDP-3-O-acyl-N-acetylglucosamine deacetylase [Rhodospirillaceae bacterium]MBT6087765.1 UDP-3-O-acyl-N-acetylglucosamine deacetylase [Rhodospirillaceae bacterium]
MGHSNDSQVRGPEITDFVHQRTLKSSISCTSVALHSGAQVKLTLHPADADDGIVFHRTDISDRDARIEALWSNVSDTQLCTAISNAEGVSVATIEHLMAALAGCGIDNAKIEIDGPEVPIMDGSSAPFVSLVEEAGVVELNAPRRIIRVLKPIEVNVGDSCAKLAPADYQELGFEIDFDSQVISSQTFSMGLVNGSFCKELARARTFGFLHEVEQMRAAGLAKGGSLDNAIVVSHDGVMNDGGLRFDDEFVRHKMLDAIGDLYLAGGPVVGRFEGVRSGHAVNNALLRALFADPDAWEYDVLCGDEAATAVDGGLHAEPAALEFA